MSEIEVGRLFCETEPMLDQEDAPLLRGCVGRRFLDRTILHNHDSRSGKEQYRYPAVQFKVVHGQAAIVAVGGEAVALLREIESDAEEFELQGRRIEVRARSLEIELCLWGDAEEMCDYIFLTPWMGLNSENYRSYRQSGPEEQAEILRRSLVGNVLSLAKGIGYTVRQHLRASYDLEATEVGFKGQRMVGFMGTFRVNFHIPDFLGIGKSPSRGYGCCMRIA